MFYTFSEHQTCCYNAQCCFLGDKIHTKLRAGQHPDAVVVCCLDSQVPPEVLFRLGSTLGRIFVIRTAGQVVDDLGMESIRYTLEHLDTKLVVVLGHDGCGAVTAACGCLRDHAVPCEYPVMLESINSAFSSLPRLSEKIANIGHGMDIPPDVLHEAIKAEAAVTGQRVAAAASNDVVVVVAIHAFDGKIKIIH